MTRQMLQAAVFGCVLITVISGCRSLAPPITYYTLSSISALDSEVDTDDRAGLTLGILPVELPGYINRLQMVTRTNHNQLNVSSLHRWADYPDRLVQQVIEKNLQTLMPQGRVVDAPWPVGLAPDVIVSFQFMELAGTTDNMVHLNVLWVFSGQQGNMAPQSHRLVLTETMNDSSYDELAAAHSRALKALSRNVAESLKAFLGDGFSVHSH